MDIRAAKSANSAGPVWYLVQCKPRQDERAEQHLLRQGFTCYRPQCRRERLARGRRHVAVESLFPGYLFIQLADDANWAPLRSTRGVSRVVGFGGQPLPVTSALIADLQARNESFAEPILVAGEPVRITQGNFADLDAIFVAMDGERRVILLLSLLNRRQRVSLPLSGIARY